MSFFRQPKQFRKIEGSYIERGVKVKPKSKLDKAIKQFQKKGYYTTDIGSGHYSSWRKEPPTLRPALFGGTFHQKNFHHPLATQEEIERK